MAGRTPAGSRDMGNGDPANSGGADRSLRVTVFEAKAEEAGAMLMDFLGPFEEERLPAEPDRPCPPGAGQARVTLVFYPPADGPSTREELLSLLPDEFAQPGALEVEGRIVPRDWVNGWREHFRPIVIGSVRIRPPWEPPAGDCGPAGARNAAGAGVVVPLVDVVINPGLGFGTGLHPTTRGTLLLLQEGAETVPAQATNAAGRGPRGPLTDVGTGSGILAIAAAKLGWGPVVALDNDPVALVSARENVTENGVEALVQVYEADTHTAEGAWFEEATVLANMTLEPVSLLLRRLATLATRPSRLVVSGILAGSQEEQIMLIAHESGFVPGRREYETEWVSFELLPEQGES